MSERFFDSRANRDKLDQWLTTPPEHRYDAQFGEEDDETGSDEEVEISDPDPTDWLCMWILDNVWSSESLPVVLETLEQASAPTAVLDAMRRTAGSPWSRYNDPVFESHEQG